MPTTENRNKVTLLLALGWSNLRIANALGIWPQALRKHYSPILKKRAEQRDRMDAAIASTGKAFIEFVARNDRMEIEREMAGQPQTERLGKKQLDERRAKDADADLMAELDQEAAAQDGATVN